MARPAARHAEHAQRHDTDVRRRKGTWTAGCTCGWGVEVVSAFAGWTATRRHLTDSGILVTPLPGVPVRTGVRLIDAEGD